MQYSRVAISETSFIELPKRKSPCTTNLIPVVFFSLFAWTLTSTVVQDQIVYRVCTTELGYSNEECIALKYKNDSHAAIELEEKVQPTAANLLMVKNLSEAILSILFTLFIGPWSDKFGRKPILVLTAIGFFLTYSSLVILNVINVHLSAWFYVFAFGFVAMAGGHVTMFVAVYCYVTDTSNEVERSRNLVVLEAVLSAGIVLGSLSSSYVYAWYGAAVVMGIATISSVIVILWTTLVLEESRVTSFTWKEKVKGIFQIEHIRDLLVVCFKKRAGVDRGVLWTVMFSLGFAIFVLQGVECVLFLFLRQKFQWDVRAYTVYGAIATVCLIFSNVVTIYCLKPITRLSDETLAVIAFVSACASSIVIALASESWHMYLGMGISTLMGVAKPMCRSIMATISKRNCEDGSEIGKLFSFTAALEAIFPVISVPLYAKVYEATLATYPGEFNVISVIIWGLCAISLSVAFQCQKRSMRRESYEELNS